MTVSTKYFGEIELDESKIITFDNGLLGFEEYKKYTLIFNSDSEHRPTISWLQSVEEQGLALPVMIPTLVDPSYNPTIEDGVLSNIGDWNEENISVLVTVTVPEDITAMTTNMRAPIIINTESMKGVQAIVEDKQYEIRFPVYKILTGADK